MTPRQRAAIEAVIGAGAATEWVHALRDARGRSFQRLEFLGDPLLETVEALQGVLTDGGVPHHADTTDASLAREARDLGIDEWLEWAPSDQRRADLVEAIAGGAYLTSGWTQVGRVFAQINGPLRVDVSDLLPRPERSVAQPDAATWKPHRAHATLGSSILETAATLTVFTASPEADEGELSALRRALHTTRRIAAWGESIGIPPRDGQWRATSDVVEAWLGRIALTEGPATAVAAADSVLMGTPPTT